MSPLLLPPILKGTLPGFPTAPEPAPFSILVIILVIPGLIALLAVGLGLGSRWLTKGESDGQAPTPDARSEILPTTKQLEARRALVHTAMLNNEARADLRVRPGKSDPDPYHP